MADQAFVLTPMHSAVVGEFSPAGQILEDLFPKRVQLWLYRWALDRGHLDTILDRWVIHPLMRAESRREEAVISMPSPARLRGRLMADEAFVLTLMHSAVGGAFSPGGQLKEDLFPERVQLCLYRWALDRGHLDTILDPWVIHPLMRAAGRREETGISMPGPAGQGGG